MSQQSVNTPPEPLDPSWTIGVPKESGVYETVNRCGNGNWDKDEFPEVHSLSKRVYWTVTPNGGWWRMKPSAYIDGEWVNTSPLSPASIPREDQYTSGLYPLDTDQVAYRIPR